MKTAIKIIIASVCWLFCVSLPIILWTSACRFALAHIPESEESGRTLVTVLCFILGFGSTAWAAFAALAVFGSLLIVSVSNDNE